MTGIYIHVPFCKRKCPYCDFYSVCRPELYEDYTQAVCRNIEAFKGRDIKCDTIYFGGGTPSVLSAEQVDRIIDTAGKCFDLCQPEITLRLIQALWTGEDVRWRKAGVTRLSFGVQSANDRSLASWAGFMTFLRQSRLWKRRLRWDLGISHAISCLG